MFPKLFEPAKIDKVRLRNRIVMLPMGTAYASAIGEVTQKTIDHYVARARGGVGMVTVGGTSPFGRRNLNSPVLDADWYMAGHYELVEAVHAEGVAISTQLSHSGRQWYPWALAPEQAPVSASDVTCYYLGEREFPKPRPLSKDEIYRIMDQWADAAGRAKKVGYDFIELHAAHGYLIEQFMSPFSNKRTDEFGGSLQNRMRFPLELFQRVRRTVGDSYPVGFRLGVEEFIDGGITIQESPTMAKMLEAAGAAYISVGCGIYETHTRTTDPMADPEGWKAYLWEAIKKAVKIPVIGGGGLKHPAFCEDVLVQGKCDFIGLARPLLADPEWPTKAREGRTDDIRPCISCLECLHGSSRRRLGGGARRCTVNAATGREAEFLVLKPAAVKRKVMVVGGGPGGMEAARVVALRGHDVTLYERAKELGGAMLLASIPPGKEKIGWFRDYLVRQIEKAGVKVRLGTEVTRELVQKEKPDALVLATGAEPLMPRVFRGKNCVSAWDVLSGAVEVSNKRVVVAGGGMVGVETAEYLVRRGNTITVVEMLPKLAADMEPNNRFVALQRLRTADVRILTGAEAVDVSSNGVTFVRKDTGERGFILAEVVVVAVGAAARRGLVHATEGLVGETYTVGDCNEPRVMMEAVYEGSRVGRRI
ncbi:MAG: FAD-dependent oxidoreductase [Chloroflexi bacterium]|nr:FAD-dependent oxidoreductase [Chloroflexota bacterium]